MLILVDHFFGAQLNIVVTLPILFFQVVVRADAKPLSYRV